MDNFQFPGVICISIGKSLLEIPQLSEKSPKKESAKNVKHPSEIHSDKDCRHRATNDIQCFHGRRPKNIAMLGTLPPLRALSGYCMELALAIADLGKLEFISFKKIYPAFIYPGGELKNDYSFPLVRHPRLKVKRRLTWYNPITWVLEGMFTKGDLMHAQCWSIPVSLISSIVCSGFKIRGKPVVFTVHNVFPHEDCCLHGILARILFKLGDHFIVHAAVNKRQMTEYYRIPPDRITHIPFGPLHFHVRGGADRDAIRKEMGFSSENRVVLLFGGIRPYKGIDTALRAFAKVLEEVPTARLLIAGKLWQRWEPYEGLMEALGIGDYVKTYLRYVPSGDVYRFFEVSDLVILPYHRFDAQSGVGATALSFRKPMVVTNVGGLPEFVGDQRCVVAPKDPSAMARAMVSCLKDPAQLQRMADRAETLASKIAWPTIAKKTWAVYRKVLRARAKIT